MVSLRIRALAQGEDPIKGYLERLIKLVPSEVVGLYLAGKGAIQSKFGDAKPDAAEAKYWIGWTLFCLVAVVLIRSWATRLPNNSPQWAAVGISLASFGIWVYSMGDVFSRVEKLSWDPLLGSLLVLAWTFVVPLFYKGDTPNGAG
jgi:hypothetical protein